MSPKKKPALQRPAAAADRPGARRVAILVVDENLKTRNLLASILSAFGIGAVLRARGDANALELFHQMRRRPGQIGVSELDLVIADWDMARIDGRALLRWIRHHPDSPDPFLPFIAMSTAPSEDQVRGARDLGASQFIARPFTIEILRDRLDAVTGDMRNYVEIRDYFGPDRRHHDVPVELDLRGDHGVGRPGVRYLVAPKRLAAKLGGRFEPKPERLTEARNRLNAWRHGCVVTAKNYLARAESRFAEIENSHDAAARRQDLADLNRISQHLHGHGRSFGFPLLITLARSLHQLTGQTLEVDTAYLKLVRAHLDALQAVLSVGPRGNRAKVGRKSRKRAPIMTGTRLFPAPPGA